MPRRVFVKICGLARAEDVQAVSAMRPDALGFVFWPHSPRAVKAGQVAAWTRELDPRILKVGVFVEGDPGAVEQTRREAGLDIVQWHGRAGEPMPDGLRPPLWRVVHLDRPPPPETGVHVDAWLVDQYTEDSPGGTGQRVDWERAAGFVRQSDRNVVLAGGLKPANILQALDRVRPWGVDVSSGVEAEPGRKDLEKVKDFIAQCRNW